MTFQKKIGLIGRNISHSFSKKYFQEKFKKEGIENLKYVNYDLPDIYEFPFITYHREEDFLGFNVTIPYKESIQKYIKEIDAVAQEVGAINTIKVTEENTLVGFNTDVYGFENSLKPLLKKHHQKALILGTGGASKAIAYVLKKLDIDFTFVSRNPINETQVSYESLTKEIMESHQLIINCTPLGTFPNVESCPNIPYDFISEQHLLYDLIYNPETTLFLENGLQQGATIKNGHEMLILQAEKAWEIWNS